MALISGSISFPIPTPPVGGSLLPLCDPFVTKLLPYWQNCINYYCSAAYAAVMAGQQLSIANAACVQTYAADPTAYLTKETWKCPLLAVFPTSAGPSQKNAELRTLNWTRVDTRYRLYYVLPPLTAEQAPRVLPLLIAVRELLVLVTQRQGDENVVSSAGILDQAGVEQVDWLGAAYDFLESDTRQNHPALTAEFEVRTRSDWDPAIGANLSEASGVIDVAGEVEGTVFPEFIEVRYP